jgi:hypothetical protein
MSDATLEKIVSILPTLEADEQDCVLEYIQIIRGQSAAAELSAEDMSELQRRASTFDAKTAIPFEQAIIAARDRLRRQDT